MKIMLLAALSPVLMQGLFKAFDEVTTARLEIPPHMISFAALCAGSESSRLEILKSFCERHASDESARNKKSPAVTELSSNNS